MNRGGGGEIGVMRQLATLNRIARIAIQDLALRPMLQRIVDILHEEFRWEFVSCASIDLRQGSFFCEAVRSSVETDIVVGYHRPLGSGIVGECALTGRTIDVDDTREHPNFVDTLHGTRSELCVPVIHDGEVLAVLNAESRRVGAFHGQRALLETVADQIAGVIRVANLLDNLQRTNAQLRDAYAKLEDLSRTDDLTGVANRRCFDLWIEQNLRETAQREQSLALLIVDVDHFKAYNDGYGHLAGDQCLHQVAAMLSYLLDGTSARLARYGGEEFVVILANTDRDAAAAIAERLRLAIQARGLEHRFTHGGLVTISVGIAACKPDLLTTANDLIAPADAALYSAKRTGRNRIWVAMGPGVAGSSTPFVTVAPEPLGLRAH
jgi:diguanylate cyclase (GGDEF)-like protein